MKNDFYHDIYYVIYHVEKTILIVTLLSIIKDRNGWVGKKTGRATAQRGPDSAWLHLVLTSAALSGNDSCLISLLAYLIYRTAKNAGTFSFNALISLLKLISWISIFCLVFSTCHSSKPTFCLSSVFCTVSSSICFSYSCLRLSFLS